jgi:hypothetical protein
MRAVATSIAAVGLADIVRRRQLLWPPCRRDLNDIFAVAGYRQARRRSSKPPPSGRPRWRCAGSATGTLAGSAFAHEAKAKATFITDHHPSSRRKRIPGTSGTRSETFEADPAGVASSSSPRAYSKAPCGGNILVADFFGRSQREHACERTRPAHLRRRRLMVEFPRGPDRARKLARANA